MMSFITRKAAVLGLLLILTAILIACGEESTVAPTSTATPTATAAPTIAPTTTPGAAATATPDATAAPTVAPVASATPVATPTPAPPPPAIMEPTGIINVGLPEVAPAGHVLHLQGYAQLKYDTLVTHEPMFVRDPEGTVHPMLVREWEVDASGLNYTFHLQEGAPWHDTFGEWGEFDADDFIFSLNDVSTEGSTHPRAGRVRGNFTCGECVLTKIDDHTVTLQRPTVTVQITWDSFRNGGGSVSMQSKKHVDAVGVDDAHFESVGTGSWRLVEAKTGEFRKVEAVRDHWRKTPEFDEMIWWEFSEESTRLANFLTGKIDTGSFNIESIQEIKDDNDPTVKFMIFPGAILWRFNMFGNNYYNDHAVHSENEEGKIVVPLGENPLDCSLPYVSCNRDLNSQEWQDAVKVRRALSIGIDRQKLVNNLASGEGEPWYVAYWTKGEIEKWGLDDLVIPFDPDEAKRLLTEAGYPDGFELDLVVTDRPPGSKAVGESVATMWRSIGIDAKISSLPYSAFRPTAVNRTATAYHAYNNNPASPEPLNQYSVFHSTANGFNFGAQHPHLEPMLERAGAAPDTAQRYGIQVDIARFLFENELQLPLYGENMVWPISEKLDTWEVGAGLMDWLGQWEYTPHRQ